MSRSKHRDSINWFREIKAWLMAAAWVCLWICPPLVLKINSTQETIEYRWHLLFYVFGGTFVLSALWRALMGDNINWFRDIKSSLMAAIWMCLLTCPLVVFKINSAQGTIDYHWHLLFHISGGAVVLSTLWWALLARRDHIRQSKAEAEFETPAPGARRGPERTWVDAMLSSKYRNFILGLPLFIFISLPLWATPYTINILITAMIYITLGLGLNIVVGVSGLLNLGYVAFYAIGAYTYALLWASGCACRWGP